VGSKQKALDDAVAALQKGELTLEQARQILGQASIVFSLQVHNLPPNMCVIELLCRPIPVLPAGPLTTKCICGKFLRILKHIDELHVWGFVIIMTSAMRCPWFTCASLICVRV
jgi:hypothetical protein